MKLAEDSDEITDYETTKRSWALAGGGGQLGPQHAVLLQDPGVRLRHGGCRCSGSHGSAPRRRRRRSSSDPGDRHGRHRR